MISEVNSQRYSLILFIFTLTSLASVRITGITQNKPYHRNLGGKSTLQKYTTVMCASNIRNLYLFSCPQWPRGNGLVLRLFGVHQITHGRVFELPAGHNYLLFFLQKWRLRKYYIRYEHFHEFDRKRNDTSWNCLSADSIVILEHERILVKGRGKARLET